MQKQLVDAFSNNDKEISHRIDQLSNQILKEKKINNFDDLKKQYQSLPRLSKNQFEQLPKEQRQEYIKVLETITTKLSANILSVNQEIDFLLKGNQHANQDFSFITLQAMQIAIEKRKLVEKERIDKIRLDLEMKKPIDLLFKRTNFKLKCYKIEKDTNTLEMEKKYFKENLMKDLKVIPFIINNFSNYMWVKIIALLRYYDKEWLKVCNSMTVVLENGDCLNEGINSFTHYKLEECLIFVLCNGDENEYKSIQRSEYGLDIKMESLRDKKTEQEHKITLYNKGLKEQWTSFTDLDKIKLYLNENVRDDYDEILKKAKILGLDDKEIIELFVERGVHNFLPSFSTETFSSKIPLAVLDPNLENGFHNQSLKLAKRWNVPEEIITELYNMNADIEKTMLDLLDISQFKVIFHSELNMDNDAPKILSPQPKL